MAARFVWTQDGNRHADTVHRARCTHTRLADAVNELHAETVEDAKREVAESMGWDTYPHDADVAFDINVAPCAT